MTTTKLDPNLFREGVLEHARYLGMDPEADVQYMWIAEESLLAPLPVNWEQLTDEEGTPYYYNNVTGESVRKKFLTFVQT